MQSIGCNQFEPNRTEPDASARAQPASSLKLSAHSKANSEQLRSWAWAGLVRRCAAGSFTRLPPSPASKIRGPTCRGRKYATGQHPGSMSKRVRPASVAGVELGLNSAGWPHNGSRAIATQRPATLDFRQLSHNVQAKVAGPTGSGTDCSWLRRQQIAKTHAQPDSNPWPALKTIVHYRPAAAAATAAIVNQS